MKKIHPTLLYNAFNSCMYFVLAIWCALQPAYTAGLVGYTLPGDRGFAEFSAVYGGIEFGIGLFYLLAVIKRKYQESALVFSMLLYGSIVFFRGYSIFTHGGGLGIAWVIAVSEWGLFAWALTVFKMSYGDKTSPVVPIADPESAGL